MVEQGIDDRVLKRSADGERDACKMNPKRRAPSNGNRSGHPPASGKGEFPLYFGVLLKLTHPKCVFFPQGWSSALHLQSQPLELNPCRPGLLWYPDGTSDAIVHRHEVATSAGVQCFCNSDCPASSFWGFLQFCLSSYASGCVFVCLRARVHVCECVRACIPLCVCVSCCVLHAASPRLGQL